MFSTDSHGIVYAITTNHSYIRNGTQFVNKSILYSLVHKCTHRKGKSKKSTFIYLCFIVALLSLPPPSLPLHPHFDRFFRAAKSKTRKTTSNNKWLHFTCVDWNDVLCAKYLYTTAAAAGGGWWWLVAAAAPTTSHDITYVCFGPNFNYTKEFISHTWRWWRNDAVVCL